MIDVRVTSRYARALLGLALERNELDQTDSTLIRIHSLLEQCPDVTRLMLNSTIPQKDKEDFLDRVLLKDVPVLISNFLKLLIKKNRFQDFPGIQEEFHRIAEENKGIVEVIAITPTPLSKELSKQLLEKLKNKLRSEIRLEAKEDPKMIGGLILRFRGREIDASYRTRLKEVQQALLS